jgi:hypothetical protein
MSPCFNEGSQVRSVTAVAVLVLLWFWESLAPFVPLFARQLRERAAHAARNLALGILNALLVSLLFV